MGTKIYVVYIMTDTSCSALYIGVTSDLRKRCEQHRLKTIPGFSAKYNTIRLVYYEQTNDVWPAIEREKQLKGWTRKKKEWLIEKQNPFWKDLSNEIYKGEILRLRSSDELRSG